MRKTTLTAAVVAAIAASARPADPVELNENAVKGDLTNLKPAKPQTKHLPKVHHAHIPRHGRRGR